MDQLNGTLNALTIGLIILGFLTINILNTRIKILKLAMRKLDSLTASSQLTLLKVAKHQEGLITKNHIRNKIAEKLAAQAYDKAALALFHIGEVKRQMILQTPHHRLTRSLEQDLKAMNKASRLINPSDEDIKDYYGEDSEWEEDEELNGEIK